MSKSSIAANTSSSDSRSFVCGVCEGFYGKPWSTEQRQELFLRMHRMGLSTYLYAPKDDHKHRLYWRDLYDDEESEDLEELIQSAKKNNVTFVYALSPGLDIVYSDDDDIRLLKAKLDQISHLGCEAFALLFDDIEPDLVDVDEEMFDSVGHAQCSITNMIYDHLKQPDVFLFCPTEYCTRRASPDLPNSDYLKTLGNELKIGIDILWTGPKVVSRRITLSGIEDVTKLIKRPPLIWDNIHANDYDQTRVYLGPYDGRCSELRNLLRGVLTNPNCEFETNFIAMHTLAQWSRNRCETYEKRQASLESSTEMEVEKFPPHYDPKIALEYAIEDWLPEFYKTKVCSKKTRIAQKDHKMNVDKYEEHQQKESEDILKKKKVTVTPSQYVKANGSKLKEKRKMEDLGQLTPSEILLICDLMYLPYEYGPRGIHLLKTAHWLISNAGRLENTSPDTSSHSPEVKEWYEKAIHFHDCHKDFCLIIDKFVNITNRDLLYDLYAYVSDLRSCLSLVNSYIKWYGMGKPDKEPFRHGEQEPWVHRGGIYSEFRRLLPLEGQSYMYPKINELSSGNRVFIVRPYSSDDRADVYRVCLKSCDDGDDGSDIFPNHPDLVPEDWIGCLLEHYAQHSYVLMDDAGICGYVTATPNIDDYHRMLRENWLPKMRAKYPKIEPNDSGFTPAEEVINTFHDDLRQIPQFLCDSYPAYMQIQILSSRVNGTYTPSLLLDTCLHGLKMAGIPGIHTVVHSHQISMIGFRLKLGFEKISTKEKVNMGQFLLLGKAI